MPHLLVRLLVIVVFGALVACTKPWASTHEYTCPDGYAFTIAYSKTDNPGDIARLEDADGTTKLPRAPAASGARYSNGATVFWSKGDEALIEQAGRVVHKGCTTG